MQSITLGENLLLFRFLRLMNTLYGVEKVLVLPSMKGNDSVYMYTSLNTPKYNALFELKEPVVSGGLPSVFSFDPKSVNRINIDDPVLNIYDDYIEIMGNKFPILPSEYINIIKPGTYVEKYLLSEAIENGVKIPSSVLMNITRIFKNIDPYVNIDDEGHIVIHSTHKGARFRVIFY